MYIEKLKEEQIKELMEIYSPDNSNLTYKFINEKLFVTLRNRDGVEENYILKDYMVEILDWGLDEFEYHRQYRKKMLEYFGKQYAIDYLLK